MNLERTPTTLQPPLAAIRDSSRGQVLLCGRFTRCSPRSRGERPPRGNGIAIGQTINPSSTTMKIPSVLVGVAGEYFVAAELSRRGYVASISLRNTRGIDILATNQSASRSITIQCKSKQVSRKTWPLNEKNEGFVADDHFLCFCDIWRTSGASELPRPSQPSCLPYIGKSHEHWLGTPGQQMNTTPPDMSPEPTTVGPFCSAIAVHVASRRWLLDGDWRQRARTTKNWSCPGRMIFRQGRSPKIVQ